MSRSPAPPSTESATDAAARILREGLDRARYKPDAWAAAMVAALELRAISYVHRWITGEQQVPLRAIVASAPTHPDLVAHVARELGALVGLDVRASEPGAPSRASLIDVVREALDVVRQASEGEADGSLSIDDCDRELRDWEDLDRVRAQRVAHLRATMTAIAAGPIPIRRGG